MRHRRLFSSKIWYENSPLFAKYRPSGLVLGIESTCDESAMALIRPNGTICAEAVASQWNLLVKNKGIFPIEAAREQKHNLPIVYNQVMQNFDLGEVEVIALATGPGLGMCLKEGSEFAKHLAEKIPKARFVAVNHLEAHLLVAKLTNEELKFPFLGCILSGGHTILVQASGIGKYKVIASTVDDAIGEAFDKIAVLLDLDVLPNESYGAAVERYASMGMPGKFQFPVPLRLNSPKDESNRSRFSFSGLKTAVRRVIDTFASGEITVQDKADMCYAFQMAACLHVEDRIKYFYQNCKENNHKWQDFTRFKHLVVCGGTAVNETIRRRLSNLAESLKLQMVVPPPKYCTDNAVMIAYTGLIKSSIGHSDPVHTAFAHRWPLE